MSNAEKKLSRTTAGVVSAVDGAYVGYIVTTVTAVGAIIIYDNASAASGTIIDVIPSGTAAGTSRNLATPIAVRNGIYADFNGGATGTVTFIFN
jgi:hypothetical protein